METLYTKIGRNYSSIVLGFLWKVFQFAIKLWCHFACNLKSIAFIILLSSSQQSIESNCSFTSRDPTVSSLELELFWLKSALLCLALNSHKDTMSYVLSHRWVSSKDPDSVMFGFGLNIGIGTILDVYQIIAINEMVICIFTGLKNLILHFRLFYLLFSDCFG